MRRSEFIAHVVVVKFNLSGQVTTLVNTKGPSQKKKGRSKKAQVLVAAVTKSVEHFIIKGEEIALENPEIKNEMLAAVEEVRKTGQWSNASTPALANFLKMKSSCRDRDMT